MTAPARPGPAPAGAAGTAPSGPAGRRPAPDSGAARRPQPEGGGLQRLAWALALLYVEVECGLRPRAHVERLLAPLLAARMAGVWVRPGPQATVVAVHGTRTAADRYDAVALVRRGRRVTALALGLARVGGRWTVVSAGRPEDGPLPAPAVAPADEEACSFELVADAARAAT